MNNPYNSYYVRQAGSGLPGFEGVRHQRGRGFFGRIFSKGIMPLLGYFGKRALSTGADILGDVARGESIKEAGKRRLKDTAHDVAEDALTRLHTMTQSGSGIDFDKLECGPIRKRAIKRRRKARTSSVRKRKRLVKRPVTTRKRKGRKSRKRKFDFDF